MRPVTSLAPSAAAPPPPGRGAPEEPAAPFAAILDDHQARTAVAEGHTPEKRSTGASDDAPCAPAATPEGGEAADAAVAQATVAVVPPPVAPATLGAFVLQAPAQGAAEGEVPAGAPVADPLPGPAASVLAGLFAGDAPMPVVPGATLAAGAVPAGLVIPAELATPSEDVPVADLTLPAAPPAPPVAAERVPVGVPAGGEAGPQADAGTGGDPRDLAGRTPQPAGATATAADASKPAAAPAAPPAPSAASAPSAPAPVSAPVAPVAVAAPASSAVPLHQAVETVRLTMHAASDRGISRARIALRPEELGGVEIHLRHTAEGLSARVVAEGPEAAQLLQQAAGDLRRSLEQQGLNLVNLEVSTTADDAANGGAGAGATGEERRQGARTGHGGSAEATEHEIALAPSTIELANGTLVDVLA